MCEILGPDVNTEASVKWLSQLCGARKPAPRRLEVRWCTLVGGNMLAFCGGTITGPTDWEDSAATGKGTSAGSHIAQAHLRKPTVGLRQL